MCSTIVIGTAGGCVEMRLTQKGKPFEEYFQVEERNFDPDTEQWGPWELQGTYESPRAALFSAVSTDGWDKETLRPIDTEMMQRLATHDL